MINYWERLFHGQAKDKEGEGAGHSGGQGSEGSGGQESGSGGNGDGSNAGSAGSGERGNGDGGGASGQSNDSNKNDASPAEAASGSVSKEDHDKLQNSYKELKTKFNTKTSDLKAQIKEEFMADQTKKRPASVDDYQYERDGIKPEELAEAPMFKWMKQQAWENNWSQETFKEGVDSYFNELAANLPDPKAELEKLGENAKPRQESVRAFVNKFLTDDGDKAVVDLLIGTANGVRAIENLMRAAGKNPASAADDFGHLHSGNVTEEEIRRLQASPEYWDAARADPAVRKKVDDYYKQKFTA